MTEKAVPILQFKNVKKRWPNGTVLDDINLDIMQGEFVGLFGLNGSGKSTLLNSISTNVLPDSGQVLIEGYDVRNNHLEASLRLGMMQQQPDLDLRTGALELLIVHGGLYGLSRSEARKKALTLLERVGLEKEINTMPKDMSGGMKQRLMFVKALMHDPKILVLDEPTAGVDIVSSQKVYNLVKEVYAKKVTIILTNHVFDDLTKMCTKMLFLKDAKIRVVDSSRLHTSKFYLIECYEDIDVNSIHEADKIKLNSSNSFMLEVNKNQDFIHTISKLSKKLQGIKCITEISPMEAEIKKSI